jgi:hypothetical protein
MSEQLLAEIAPASRLLTAAEFHRLADVPPEVEWFANLSNPSTRRAYEHALENSSVTVRALRPWMQAAQYFALREAGERAVVRRDGWYLPARRRLPHSTTAAGDSTSRDAFAAVVHFVTNSPAAEWLILMPAPNKESVYPDKLAHSAPPRPRHQRGNAPSWRNAKARAWRSWICSRATATRVNFRDAIYGAKTPLVAVRS